MKKTAIILSLCAVIAACSNNKSDQNVSNDSTTAANQSAKSQESDADTNATKIGTDSNAGNAPSKGAQLIASADCLGCHKEQEKLVGPAYKDVAKKYPSNDKNITYLANKIISGGKGVWGDVPMTPHPNLALADAKEMAKYVLSLK
ncbi:c-type cytochrome [Mucilaginibacter arboris]|uniref:C-type cytochrome n=1 Tax=Mucilaginibacter arboris TaxID=2682090 RepID=A0A7K1SYL7_9SPHI|nr:c-type cytochrome [Mucilaginibacter arboris]MVN22358.1 c-type cytochrome [Mucilaginibacter arboris]